MRYCIFCGVEIPGDAKYCQICGKIQPENTVTAIEESQEEAGFAKILNSPPKMILAGAGLFLAVLVIATGIMVLLLKN